MARKSKKVATPSLTVEDQIEAEITAMQPLVESDARVDAAMADTNPRISVEVSASKTVVPDAPVNEGPVERADIPDAQFEDGEFVIPEGRTLAHAFASVTDTTFTAVCGRTYYLSGAVLAGALSPRCAYCEDGDTAPADLDDEPATLKPRTGRTSAAPVSVTDPEHVAQFDALTSDLVAYLTEHGNGADARAFYAVLTRTVETVKPLTKRDRSRAATATGESGTRTYVRVMPTGRVTVTLNLNGESVSVASMGDACRKLAECMPTAEKCAAYVKRVDVDKLTANARVFLQADIDAGRVPADAVIFGTK